MKGNKILVITIFFLFLFTLKVFPQQSPLYYEGGAESVLYGSDTIMLENTATDEGQTPGPGTVWNAGLSMLYSEFMSIIYVPVNYSLTQNFELNFALPYFRKSVTDDNDEEYSKHGFGDTGLGLSYFFVPMRNIHSITRFKCALPTGDPVASDGATLIPMGYGTPVFSVLETLSMNIDTMSIRFFANAGTVYYPETVRDSGVSRYHISKRYILSTLAGIEHEFKKDLFFQLKINFVYIPESEYKVDYSMNTGTWRDRNDSMLSSDFIPVVKYRFLEDFTACLTGILPVFEEQDNDIEDVHHRGWKVMLSITKEFLSESPGSKNIINKKKGYK